MAGQVLFYKLLHWICEEVLASMISAFIGSCTAMKLQCLSSTRVIVAFVDRYITVGMISALTGSGITMQLQSLNSIRVIFAFAYRYCKHVFCINW